MNEVYRIILLPEVVSDLASIHDFIERDSPQNAVAVIRKLMESIDTLDQFPQRCKIHLSSTVADRVVRSMSEPPFIIYYRVIDLDHVVEVMTIRHGARKQPKRFKRRG
jgi:plasmid stabilization system protein ParE